MAPEELYSQLSLGMVNLCLKSYGTPFASSLSYIYFCGSESTKFRQYGSNLRNTDFYPQVFNLKSLQRIFIVLHSEICRPICTYSRCKRCRIIVKLIFAYRKQKLNFTFVFNNRDPNPQHTQQKIFRSGNKFSFWKKDWPINVKQGKLFRMFHYFKHLFSPKPVWCMGTLDWTTSSSTRRTPGSIPSYPKILQISPHRTLLENK